MTTGTASGYALGSSSGHWAQGLDDMIIWTFTEELVLNGIVCRNIYIMSVNKVPGATWLLRPDISLVN